MNIEWINVKDRLPNENGEYLVVYTYFDYKSIKVLQFARNLYEIDKYSFKKDKRQGWYEWDNEYGYFERTGVTHWTELPQIPND